MTELEIVTDLCLTLNTVTADAEARLLALKQKIMAGKSSVDEQAAFRLLLTCLRGK